MESVGVLSIIPVIDTIFSENNYFVEFFKNQFLASTETALYLVFISVFLIYVIKFFVSSYVTYIQKRIVTYINADITQKLFKEYLKKPYVFHINKNSSELIKNLQIEINHLFLYLEAFLIIITETIILIAIIATIIYLSPIGIIIFSIFSLSAFLLYKFVFFKRTINWGNERKNLDSSISKIQLESFSGIKEIKLNNLEFSLIKIFDKKVFEKAILSAKHLTSLQISRYLFEIVIILVIITYLIVLKNSGYNIQETLSIIGVFGVAAIKIIPSISKILNSYQGLNYYASSLIIIAEELNNKKEEEQFRYSKSIINNLNFNNKLELRIKKFGYDTSHSLFNNFKLEIFKNEFLVFLVKVAVGNLHY